MSHLVTYAEDDSTTPLRDTADGAAITAALAEDGIRFERWATRDLPADAEQDAILAAYADEVSRLQAEGGYRAADVIHLAPDHPQREAIRAKFLDEHTHAEDEVRFFVQGRGLFFLHLNGRVHRLLCTRGDLLSVPAGTTHWFDTGAAPDVTAIRLFTDPEGWVARYTGTDLATRFPTLEP